MDKKNKFKILRAEFKAKREKYVKEKIARVESGEQDRSQAQVNMDIQNHVHANNKSYAWRCKQLVSDPLDKVLDQIERDSKCGGNPAEYKLS